jgi:hypothetical protein
MTPLAPGSALFEAIVARLKADPDCVALFADRIFDVPPGDDEDRIVTPFVHLGPCGMRRATELGCNTAWRFGLRLFVTSTEAGRVEAWNACHAVFEALHEWEPDLIGHGWHAPMPVMVELAGDAITPLEVKQCFVDVTGYVQKP